MSLRRPWYTDLIAFLIVVIAGTFSVLNYTKEDTISVTLYVMGIDEGADIEQYKIEQVGDQLTYQLPEHVMRNIQQSPSFVDCIDGLAISSVWTQFAKDASCDGPAIHVVLIAPY